MWPPWPITPCTPSSTGARRAAGIAVNDDGVFTAYRDVGLVNEVFPAERLDALGTGTMAVGHVRYGTTGVRTTRRTPSPWWSTTIKGRMALAHNGNLTNAHELRAGAGAARAPSSTPPRDSEVIAYIITQERLHSPSIEEAVCRRHGPDRGGLLPGDHVPHASSSPSGTPTASGRCAWADCGTGAWCSPPSPAPWTPSAPGSSGTSCPGRSWWWTSTACAVRHPPLRQGAQAASACSSSSTSPGRTPSSTGPASTWHGSGPAPSWPWSIPVQADIVIGVPDSGLDAALGYARQSGIPYGMGFIKNKYIGRTFISAHPGHAGERGAASS